MSTCAKCGGHLFRIQSQEPSGSHFILYFVQCSTCGVPVGVMEYFNNGAILKEIEQKMDTLKDAVDQIEYQVSYISSRINK